MCLNGKALRLWSALRPQLQSVVGLRFRVCPSFFLLAKALLETYVSKPIEDVVMDGDDGETVNSLCMNVKPSLVIEKGRGVDSQPGVRVETPIKETPKPKAPNHKP